MQTKLSYSDHSSDSTTEKSIDWCKKFRLYLNVSKDFFTVYWRKII